MFHPTMRIKIGVALAVLAILIIVASQNAEVVTLRFLFWETSLSLVALVFMTMGVGLLAGWTIGVLGRRRKSLEREDAAAGRV